MSDNFDVTPGSGRKVATDQVSYSGDTADVQLMKIVTVSGAEGSKTVADGLAPSENHLGEVGGNSQLISPSITVSTSPAYSIGDVVGGKLTLGILRVSNGSAVLQSLLIIDKSNQKAPLDIYLFDSDPTAGTYTDNSAVVFSTDTAKMIARVPVAVQDYVTNNSIAVAHIRNIGAVLRGANGNTNLYAVMVTSQAVTYAATSDLIARFGAMDD